MAVLHFFPLNSSLYILFPMNIDLFQAFTKVQNPLLGLQPDIYIILTFSACSTQQELVQFLAVQLHLVSQYPNASDKLCTSILTLLVYLSKIVNTNIKHKKVTKLRKSVRKKFDIIFNEFIKPKMLILKQSTNFIGFKTK